MTDATESAYAANRSDEAARPHGTSRRHLLGLTGAGAALGVAGFAGGFATRSATASAASAASPAVYPFHGPHQAGIATPAQDRLHFAAFDVTTTDRAELVALLRAWSVAAARMTAGQPSGAEAASYDAPPADTGEADGLPASGLTITIGFGPGLFRDASGKDRFGIADRAPKALRDLPHFPGDRLDEARSGGDLCVQACADDPQVAVHAVRNLARIGFGTVSLRWSQLGFGRTSSTSTGQATPRNLFGFKDGTANLKADDPDLLDKHVWVARGDDAGAEWLTGGSYLVARRINMQIETWDRTSLREQETNIGRDRANGAPLSGGTEFTEVDLAMKGRGGDPIIDPCSHVRLAHPSTNGGIRMLRRGYNFTDGSNALGRIDAGLFFIAFVRSPDTHYIPMQMRLASRDLLSEYLQHTGSGIFAVPPGAPGGSYVGASLFGER